MKFKYKIKEQPTIKNKEIECPNQDCKEKIKIVVTGDYLIEFKDKNDDKKAQIGDRLWESVTIECFKCGNYLIFTRDDLIG